MVKALLSGSSGAGIITIQNVGAGNAYTKFADGSVLKWCDVYAIPYDSPSQNVIFEDCDLVYWTSVSTNQSPFWKLRRCFISGYGDNLYINYSRGNSDSDPQWENVVIGYRRNGAAAAVTRAFVLQAGRITIRNFLGNYTTLMSSDGDGVALVVDNMGYVVSSMLPGTGSAMDLAVVAPGIGYEYRYKRGTMERSASAKKTGDYGERMTPVSQVTSNYPLESSIHVPITTGDDIAVSVYGRRHTMTNDCAEVEIDPEGAFFTPNTSATELTNDDQWYEFTPTGTNSSGTGMVRVVLRLKEYQAAAYFDWADFAVTIT